jgi:hypothetical protein
VNHVQLRILLQRKNQKLILLWLRHFCNNAFLLSSLRKTHNGKLILFCEKAIYNGTFPNGEEAHLFQYSVINVNNYCKTATIDFDEKCIVENRDTFQNYPNFADEETSIGHFNADHELFNVHLGQVNEQVNNLRESERNKKQDEKVRSSDDV